ncbi:MAG: PadR family transcriptional regulator [Acidobacteriota bacterium]|nr:PadR family transcriptional regulator [Acidobacteriota bacterium]
MPTTDDLELGHFSDPPMLILASLASGPKDAHAMAEDVALLCGARLRLGTLYGAIYRLEEQGLVKPLPQKERSRQYRITAKGARVLRARLVTLRRFTEAGWKRVQSL